MNKVSFELEVVTPLFLGGADGKTAELRPPSIRGAMRFWFRAMMGGIVGGNIEALKKLEADVFGDTDKASSMILRVGNTSLDKGNYNPLPHKEKKFEFEGFKPDQKFNLSFSMRNPKELPKLEIAILSFLLLINLGGIGKRSRRGYGSLRIIKTDGDLTDKQFKSLFDSQPNSHEELENKLFSLINLAGSKFVEFARPKKPSTASSSFPYFNLDSNILIVREPYERWLDAIKDVMFRMRGYKNDVFGRENPRQASPLIVKVHKVEDKAYKDKPYKIVLTAFLKTSLNPSLKVDWTKMKDFLDQIISDRKGTKLNF